ncbi:hypothetical protein CALVIDRAFT_537359 [Calocera viscosa TUFC12733]|uniref:F-box domain-containing protein n=1 Tax=Calocera viscosa (strain TUFC12733) TaxID=1330018 RepID=A0A167LYH3_CALVF|nr:hypothetical protein CALVIDRAFT_537359 [Calocera viscosa TUFC12733]
MDSTSSRKLTQDVWRYIFEEIVDEAKSAHIALPLLLVCKQWKAIALPLLYRYLHFYEPPSITKCLQTLVRQGIRGAYPGNSTRSIALDDGTPWPDITAPRLERLLRYTPRLKVFNSSMLPVGTDILDILGQTCGPLLEKLDIAIGGKSTDVTLQLALLNRFTSLEHLTIELFDMAQIISMDTPALDMPSLGVLILSCFTDEPWSSLVHFLCRSSFVALDFLSLIDYSGQLLGQQPCQTVLPLLETFGHQLLTVALYLPSGEDVARLLFGPLKTVKKIYLLCTLPDDIGRFLPASLNELQLHIDFQDGPQMQDLLQCLDNLRDKKRKTHALEMVQLYSWATNVQFYWSTIGANDPAFAGNLMLRSIGLQSKGIKLLDSAGKSVTLS